VTWNYKLRASARQIMSHLGSGTVCLPVPLGGHSYS
jgi:hypothetical protein